MFLISNKKKNHNRWLKKTFIKSNSIFLKRILNIVSVKKKLSVVYKKNKIFYKKRTKFKNKIYKILNFSNIFVNCAYTIISEKPSYFSNTILGLVKINKYIYKNYLLKKQIYINNNFIKKKKNITINGSLFFFPLFYGYFLLNNISSFGLFNNFFFTGMFLPIFKLNKGCICFYVNSNNKNIYAKSSGTYCSVLDKNIKNNFVLIKLPSGLIKKINFNFFCIVGRNANIYSKYRVLGKASNYFFIKKKKQSVRGVAMNPVDHPNGGRSKVKKPFKSPWGWVAKKTK